MQALSLDPKQSTATPRPASEFPEPADLYVCDKCGKDVTAHLHCVREHVRRPIGPVRYVCRCGQDYLSGATEWDNLSEWDKRQWLRDIPLIFILLAGFATYGAASYLALSHRSLIMIVLSLVGMPFAAVFLWQSFPMFAIPFKILGSVLRTRVFDRA